MGAWNVTLFADKPFLHMNGSLVSRQGIDSLASVSRQLSALTRKLRVRAQPRPRQVAGLGLESALPPLSQRHVKQLKKCPRPPSSLLLNVGKAWVFLPACKYQH